MYRWIMLVALASGACSDTTEIVVIVDTDLRVPEEIDTIQVSVQSLGVGGYSATHEFSLAETGLPLSFSVAPGDMKNGTVNIEVVGQSPDGENLVTWLADTRFRSGRSLELEAPLARVCIIVAEECDRETTCRMGECADPFIDSQDLPNSSGRPHALFDGPSEPDAGAPDATVCDDEGMECIPLNPTEACLVGAIQCSPTETCVATSTPRDDGFPCGDGRVCSSSGTCGLCGGEVPCE